MKAMSDEKIIKYGTPLLDGRLDDDYLASYCYVEDSLDDIKYSPLGLEKAREIMKNTSGKVYFLHDDSYLYVCAVIRDETICTRGKEWRENERWPWNDDGAEFYIHFSDEDCFAIHCDAHNYRAVMDTHVWGDMHNSSFVFVEYPHENWAATIDRKKREYTVEIRIKLPDYVGVGSKVGFLLEIDDRWAVGEGSEDMVGAMYKRQGFEGTDEYDLVLGGKEI